jgi:hypothetical protein
MEAPQGATDSSPARREASAGNGEEPNKSRQGRLTKFVNPGKVAPPIFHGYPRSNDLEIDQNLRRNND